MIKYRLESAIKNKNFIRTTSYLMAINLLFLMVDIFIELKDLLSNFNTTTFESKLGTGIEIISFISIVFGLIAMFGLIKSINKENQIKDDKINIFQGDFENAVNTHFKNWNLTKSEHEIGMLLLKGLDLSEIASIRDSKIGTIKVHCNKIYKKSNCKSRAEFMSILMDDIIRD